MIKCMLFLYDKNTFERKEGFGVHDFGRIPVVGEYIALSYGDDSIDDKESIYKVTHVLHTGFSSNHVAELFVTATDGIQYDR